MLAVFVFFQLVESFLFCFSSLLSTCSVSFTMRTCFCAAFQGWYIVTYALGIYHLNLFIAFLSPKVDPSLLEEGKLAKLHWASGYVLCYLKFFLQRVNADGLCPVFTCRWRPIPSYQAEWRVPPFHSEVAWIQILVGCDSWSDKIITRKVFADLNEWWRAELYWVLVKEYIIFYLKQNKNWLMIHICFSFEQVIT